MIWITIAGMALVTFLPRLIPMALGRDIRRQRELVRGVSRQRVAVGILEGDCVERQRHCRLQIVRILVESAQEDEQVICP